MSFCKIFLSCMLFILYSGCTESRASLIETNPYVGTWKSTYVYTSGYTNPIFFPVAIKHVQHTMTIRNDNTFEQQILLTYANDTVSSASFSGTYTYTDSEIVMQKKAGLVENKPITEERLPEPETLIRHEKTLTSKDAYYAESPERNEQNELKYPIILTFVKKTK